MIKIYLKAQQINNLLHWRDENKDLVRECVIPFPDCEIISKENGVKIRTKQRYAFANVYDFTISDTIEYEVKGRFSYSTLSGNVTHGVPELSEEDVQTAITVWATLMAYIVNFNPEIIKAEKETAEEKEQKEKKEKPKNIKDNRITYLNRTVRITTRHFKHKYTEPTHSFSVRGHYRHLKSGKIVYVHPHEKYTYKNKPPKNRIIKITNM